MAVSLSTIASQVNALFNFATTYTATVSSPRSYTQFVADNVLTSDGMVIEAGITNPSNGWRVAFLSGSPATVAHGGALPSRIGAIGSVTFSGVPATEVPFTEITYERTLSLTFLNAHYAIFDNKLFHNQGANNATVDYYTYTRTSSCQAPDFLAGAVLCGAAMLTASIEGEDPATQSFYGQQFNVMLEALRSGREPQPFRSYREAA